MLHKMQPNFLTDKKVIILMCDTCSLKSEDDETTVKQTIERIIGKQGKGFVTSLTKFNGRLRVDADFLVQALTAPPPQPNLQLNLSSDCKKTFSDATSSAAISFPRTNSGPSQSDLPKIDHSEWELGRGRNEPNTQPPTQQVATTILPYHPPAVNVTGEPVLLRSLLLYGRISHQPEDLQLLDPTFTVPDHINQNLFQQYCDTPVTGVTIVRGIDGTLRWSVNPKLIEISRSRYEGIQIADNETLKLKTRILYGQVSFQEKDVHFRFGTWQIPQHIVESLKEEYGFTPSGELYIISNDRGNLRKVVKVGTLNRVRSAANKRGL